MTGVLVMPGRGVGRWFEMVILAPPRSASREGVVALPREGVVALPSVPLRAVFLKKGLMGRQLRLLHTRQSKATKNTAASEHRRCSEAASKSSYSEPSSVMGLAAVLVLASVGGGGTISSSTTLVSGQTVSVHSKPQRLQ